MALRGSAGNCSPRPSAASTSSPRALERHPPNSLSLPALTSPPERMPRRRHCRRSSRGREGDESARGANTAFPQRRASSPSLIVALTATGVAAMQQSSPRPRMVTTWTVACPARTAPTALLTRTFGRSASVAHDHDLCDMPTCPIAHVSGGLGSLLAVDAVNDELTPGESRTAQVLISCA